MTRKHSPHARLILPIALLLLGGCVYEGSFVATPIVPVISASIIVPTVPVVSAAVILPPPYAPVHGYVHAYGGLSLTFDSHLGLYAVGGTPGCYFYEGHYYRYYDSDWHISVSLAQPSWIVAPAYRIPHGLIEYRPTVRVRPIIPVVPVAPRIVAPRVPVVPSRPRVVAPVAPRPSKPRVAAPSAPRLKAPGVRPSKPGRAPKAVPTIPKGRGKRR